MVDLTVTDWDSVVGSDRPVLVYFWAPWCGPCRALTPTLRTLSDHFAGKVVFARVNTDECPELCAHGPVTVVPSVLLFAPDRPIVRLEGAIPAFQLTEAIYRLLGF